MEAKIATMPAAQQPIIHKGIRYFKLQAPVEADPSESSDDKPQQDDFDLPEIDEWLNFN